ncbi:hypothetical protein K1T71_001202 [Dendrolimus kikuchii]|uniref:Uncharacterized protein n=1 Tax=Dendrolimus kikuchii TaxID=765133 RepID=A0ACC1DIL8_9NEOP|nr:hypothetical protein K1T71_001202 [Dendrolimus kikuchii]
MLIIFVTCVVCLGNALGEEFNLYGEAGQAYSVDVNLGHPHQKLSVIVDTGSTTLAIASHPRIDSDIYFHADNSSSIYDNQKEVQAKYSQGMWVGRLISDYIQIPSLPSVLEVRSDIALITKSHKFFMNGSGWQGLLGLAYLPVGAWGDHIVVESWLDSLERTINKPVSFQLQLCGPIATDNATHCGYFRILDDQIQNENRSPMHITPILRKSWYEVGVISVRLISSFDTQSEMKESDTVSPSIDMCRTLNAEKSIVDSGTTNIRLPDTIFRQIVDELRNFAGQKANLLILDEFWYRGEAACWPEPQEWHLPWLAIDLLSDTCDHEYFTLMLTPQNYMRVVTAHNSSGEGGMVSEFCYKLGLEAGKKETVLGYTAMEGLQLLFNRSAGWIGWETSDCGPKAQIAGPYNLSMSLKDYCQLTHSDTDVAISIKAAQWALCAISIIAGAVLLYLLAPCIKAFFIRRSDRSTQISLSQAALVEQDVN